MDRLDQSAQEGLKGQPVSPGSPVLQDHKALKAHKD